MVLHDNASAHSTIRVRQFLTQKMVAVLDRPPYSPDLTPANFFLFPRLKAAIKGACFADVNIIKDRVTAVLRSVPRDAFTDSFWKLYELRQTCFVAEGDYFEGQLIWILYLSAYMSRPIYVCIIDLLILRNSFCPISFYW